MPDQFQNAGPEVTGNEFRDEDEGVEGDAPQQQYVDNEYGGTAQD